MINLLPPPIKKQIAYAKRNRLARRYTLLLGSTLAISTAALGGAYFYVSMQLAQVDTELTAINDRLKQYNQVEKDAKAANARLQSLKTLATSQSKFSELLADIASVTPRGVAIDGMALTGDDKKPMRITAIASSYDTGLSLRDGLARSSRIAGADLESIARNDDGTYKVTVSVAFKTGSAK